MKAYAAMPVNAQIMEQEPAAMRRLARRELVAALRSQGYRAGLIRFLVDPRERHGLDEFPAADEIQTGYRTHIIAAIASVSAVSTAAQDGH